MRPRLNNSSFRGRQAFTLIEVMIAMGIFFIAIFSILELVGTNLRNARLLQKPRVDANLLIADLYQTNRLFVGTEYGDFGDLYPGYKWEQNITRVNTNGFFQVDITIIHPDNKSEQALSVLLWRPDSPADFTGGLRR